MPATFFLWNAQTNSGAWLDLKDLPPSSRELPEGAICWIDLQSPSPNELERVFTQFLPIHPLSIEDITRLQRQPDEAPHFSKVEEFPDYLLVIVNPLEPNQLDSESGCVHGQFSAVLTHSVLITHHTGDSILTQHVRESLQKNPQQANRGPDYLLHLLLDNMVDQYAPTVDTILEELDEIESIIFQEPSSITLNRLLLLKRRIVHLRKTLIMEREVLARLIRGEFELVDDREVAYYRNVYDHLVRYAELLETSREMVSDLMQTQLAAVSNRRNGVMKGLDTISTIILPMTLISGIYGMNFEFMPELKWVIGYPLALSMMVLAAAVSLYFFRRQKWI